MNGVTHERNASLRNLEELSEGPRPSDFFYSISSVSPSYGSIADGMGADPAA